MLFVHYVILDEITMELTDLWHNCIYICGLYCTLIISPDIFYLCLRKYEKYFQLVKHDTLPSHRQDIQIEES